MSLTSLAIERNRVTMVALVCVLLAGMGAYANLPKAEDPGFIIRTALVMTYLPGASPERIEELVTDRIEKAVREMPELDFVESRSKTGVSIVFVNVQERYKEMRPIWDRLRRKIESAARGLPDGVAGPYVNDEFGDVFGTIVGITGDGYSYRELKEVADDCRNELLLIDEVAKVEILGAQQERIYVEYDNARLSELGISASQLKGMLQQRNIIIPGGSVNTGLERIALEPTGNFDSIEDLARTIVRQPSTGGLLFLEDIATVRRGYLEPAETSMRMTGTPALALAISLRDGGNVLKLGKKVAAAVQYFESVYPIGLEFDFGSFQADHVHRKVRDFEGSILQAVAIVLLVMIAFLGLRTGLVVAALIPMAIVTTLFVMSGFSIGIDQMSLASLIIALGMLVDNSIVMSESIMVQMEEGRSPVDAAVASAAELRVPLLTSSLTTAAAFLPIYLAESSTGEYTAPLFKVVTIALLSSWLLALTMTPLLCVWFLRRKNKGDARGEGATRPRVYRLYRRALAYSIQHRALVLGIVVLIFVGVMRLFAFLPNVFFPANDKPIYTVQLELPVGTPIGRTAEVVERVETYMLEEQRERGLLNWMTFVGETAPRFFLSAAVKPARPEYAMLVVNARSQRDGGVLMRELERFCDEQFPDVRATIDWLPLGPPASAPIEVRISSRDRDVLFEIAQRVKQKLGTLDTKNIRDNWGQRTKKLMTQIDQARAMRAGLTSTDVAVSLQTSLTGIRTTEYREGDKVIPVMLRERGGERQDLGRLETLSIYAQGTGRAVPLKQVADVGLAFEPARIFRRNGLRTITVSADLAGTTTAIDIANEMDTWLQQERGDWPVGTTYSQGGEQEASGKANASINAKMPIALVIIVLLLVAQFNSLRKPAIILFTVPLGLIGVVLGLLLARSYFGFMTLLGIISLTGIVINNAIVLLERIQLEIDDNGLSPYEATLQAAERRLRPILLTTATTMGGLLPLWLGGGPMWEPMAIAIIFGLLFATVLTLGVVPTLYATFFRVRVPSQPGAR